MSVVTLVPNSNWEVPYQVPFDGRIRYEVESNWPVSVYAVAPENLAAYRAGQSWLYHAAATTAPQLTLRNEMTLPFRGTWHLFFINNTGYYVAVHFNVWSG